MEGGEKETNARELCAAWTAVHRLTVLLAKCKCGNLSFRFFGSVVAAPQQCGKAMRESSGSGLVFAAPRFISRENEKNPVRARTR